MSSPSTEDIYVGFPDSLLPTALPRGWSVAKEVPLQIEGPERDLTISFLVLEAEGAEQALQQAWAIVSPGFDLRVRQQAEAPSTSGWDSTAQAFYDSPAGDGRVAFAVVRGLGNRRYVNLVQGAKASFDRRMAQLGELISAWKPSGLKEPSLAGVVPRELPEAELDKLRGFVQDSMRKLQIPGIAIAIVRGGRTVFAEGFGVCRAGESAPITSSTRFMIGSSTKPLTSLLMATLVDGGHFSWDTPVQSVLPEFALADAEVTAKLKMKHTVCACTGMPRRDTELLFRFKDVSAEDRIAEMRAMSPTTGFGETFQYSNHLVAAGGYAAAHSFAPDLSLGQAYEKAMRELVFAPLGMVSTSVHAGPGENAFPHGRDLAGQAVTIDPILEQFADAVAPAGSVWSTVLDMAEYVKCELSEGFNQAGERIVSAENLLLRRKPGIRIDEKSSYGLGLIALQDQGLNEVTHGGNTLGFTADMVFMPEHDLGYVVLANVRVANAFLSAFHQRLLEVLFGAQSKAEAMIAAAVQSREKHTEILSRTVHIDSEATAGIAEYIGRYESAELGPAELTKGENSYRITFESWASNVGVAADTGEKRELVLTSAPWRGGIRLRIEEESGSLVLDMGQQKYTFVRVE